MPATARGGSHRAGMPTSPVPGVLRARGGVATWSSLAAVTSTSAVARAVTSGAVVLALPGVLVRPDRVDHLATRTEAALLYAGEGAQLSHVSALARYGLPVPASDVVHVLVPHDRRRRTVRKFPVEVEVHRSRTSSAPNRRHGFDLVPPERAVVDSWPLLRGSDQRAPALVAVRRRLVTATALQSELDRHLVLGQRPSLQRLLRAVSAGCRSELELWGYEQVFTGEQFAELRRQVEVVAAGTAYVLDSYDPRAATAIELDGRRYHDSRQRERDAARDARIATLGIQTVRFSHERLTLSAQACREEAWQTLQVRRGQLQGWQLPQVVAAGAAGPTDAGSGVTLRLAMPPRGLPQPDLR